VIRIMAGEIEVTTHIWSESGRTFVAGPHKCFAR
jgi:hypothetical protein